MDSNVIVNQPIAVDAQSAASVFARRVRSSSADVYAISGMTLEGGYKWNQEDDTAEDWTEIEDTPESWTQLSGSSKTWTEISDTPEIWTPVSTSSEIWTQV
jgi:hypothetical protein